MAVMVQVDGKNFNNNNSGQFVVASLGINTKFTWIVVIKIPSLPLLAAPFDFTTFFYARNFEQGRTSL